ncbi:MAG: hypothetical protein K2P93_04350 [Alphaproteobacteria bacterium]|nr:hypothetical protein [Alphaproteobacteria bacterium]
MHNFRKIKLALFSSGFILSSYNVYAMMNGSEERIDHETTGNHIAPSAEFLEDPALPSSSQALKERKEVLEDVSARLGPIGALLPTFENPSSSPRKKERHIGIRGERDIFEISSPSSSMETKSVQDFEKELPDRLREFSDRFNRVNREKLTKKQNKDFQQLLSSFRDVEKSYRNFNPDYQSIPEEMQRRFYVKRRATIGVIQRNKIAGSTETTVIATEHNQVITSSSLPLDAPLSSKERTEEGLLSEGLSLSSSVPPRPLRLFERRTHLQRLQNGSSSSYRPLPIPPNSAVRCSSSSTPTSPRLPRLNNGNSRPLPVPPKPFSSSSIPSSSPPFGDSSIHPPVPPSLPPRSRSLSIPVKKTDPLPSIPLPSSSRWASYSQHPLVSLKAHETDQSDQPQL